MATDWTPDSWRDFEARQLPTYPDQDKLDKTLDQLSTFPPLILGSEARLLKEKLATVAKGEAFVVQGGDCAESFRDFSAESVRATLSALLWMNAVIAYAMGKPVVRLGRLAGQFAKPRSSDMEEKNGISLPSYRGDNVNDIAFTEEARLPSPERLLQGHTQAAITLNLIRAYTQAGDDKWEYAFNGLKDFVHSRPWAQDSWRGLVAEMEDSFRFAQSCGGFGDGYADPCFTSHEALHLPYEETMVRSDCDYGLDYATSGHFLWIGDRTRFEGSAHVEFLRGVDNPIGLKCGPNLKPDELLRLLDILDPAYEAGRITLITRYGHDKIEKHLPELVSAVKAEGRPVVWICDPMHGNGTQTSDGQKTRPFERILAEVKGFFAVHEAEGTYAGGIHLEMTGLDVTECIGGSAAITEEDLKRRYLTQCDPRLSRDQALEMAFQIADLV
ncbi:MAG: 3-deoxy-7-phosphoheptulonate synthase class II [Zymomonas mobilis subsp. pomaceae]|uniref:Phospho-2-dehydro-3-deoxyheptonate aldolase n=1 Tax=Zymomonas mobilis subsp. pomaceae (strain ATCC 29192 / DSM 22645 / JCM 10191 / CCUG 17912 / NBRC 13757 / NCIMB 11200 / NRRL B-4491 / Barker I) TaxID=579138 RepID=F8ESX7_ZYMMT|nr:3-deoxy-7-phosphoheptulonate synthase class II [Zymomonas mobilis]AEI37881.1 3-deoxy-7-phosphoheptulonate synthase [Zymomonas mobilis subsp. pomaceae ATCC 29192]MDX5949247.1 3-deoxy-7-phosphoheptulonate synthase class II [Zymomonas mobilis subsp. pomaceae]GEB89523.1 phospho-2-dehydro-3-deoxyheptonate aldolase [Zymomonas mobilis subsp. pomaceae]